MSLVAGALSALNRDCPWQRNGSKAEAAASGLFFSGLRRVSCFQGSQGAVPGRWSRACLENTKRESREQQDGETPGKN